MAFKKGDIGNPNGRPKGSRHRFSEAFWHDLAEEWQAGGAEAMKAVRTTDPATFVRVAASLMPKETNVTLKSEIDTMTDAELRKFIQTELTASGGRRTEAEVQPDPVVTH